VPTVPSVEILAVLPIMLNYPAIEPTRWQIGLVHQAGPFGADSDSTLV
jgi:hypothetical protein